MLGSCMSCRYCSRIHRFFAKIIYGKRDEGLQLHLLCCRQRSSLTPVVQAFSKHTVFDGRRPGLPDEEVSVSSESVSGLAVGIGGISGNDAAEADAPGMLRAHESFETSE